MKSHYKGMTGREAHAVRLESELAHHNRLSAPLRNVHLMNDATPTPLTVRGRPPLHKDPSCRERNYGVWEGRTREEAKAVCDNGKDVIIPIDTIFK